MLLAWFLSNEDPTVKVAFIGMAGAVIVGVIQKVSIRRNVMDAKSEAHTARETANAVKDAIGEPNGKGNVVQMNEKQLTRLGVIEDKLDFMTDLLLKHISTPGAHGGHSGYSPMDEYTSGR